MDILTSVYYAMVAIVSFWSQWRIIIIQVSLNLNLKLFKYSVALESWLNSKWYLWWKEHNSSDSQVKICG